MSTTRSAREPRPTSPFSPESLGAGAGVRDEERGDHGRDGDHDGPLLVMTREDERDRGEHRTLADAIGRGVDEGSERGGLAAHARERSVEDVEQRADDEDACRQPVDEQRVRRFSNGTRIAAARQSETPVAVSTFGVMPVRARPVTERLASERAPSV